MSPIGLGYLHYTGYLGDARTFYCPTVGGTMPADEAPGWSTPNNAGVALAATSPKDLQRAGGFDAKALSSGDWDWLRSTSIDVWGQGWYPGWSQFAYNGRVIQSDYNYRGVASILIDPVVLDAYIAGGAALGDPATSDR